MEVELELLANARENALRDLLSIKEPYTGTFNACGYGRFRNPFTRDDTWGIAQGLDSSENYFLDPQLLIFPAVNTLYFLTRYQSDFNILVDGDHQVISVLWPGRNPHEIHTKFTPSKREEELRQDGWKSEKMLAEDDIVRLINYTRADDVNSQLSFAVEMVSKALEVIYSPEVSQDFLERMWPRIEANILHDIFYASRSDKLIVTLHQPGNPIINKTWRDSGDSMISDDGIPQGDIAYYANNCFYARGLRSFSRIARRLGYFGMAESASRISEAVIERIHDLFWMEDEECFALALNHDGRKHIRAVTNESLIGLFTETIYEEYAPKVAGRMLASDLMTTYGTRTRSMDDPYFVENDTESYHRGTIWLHMDTSGVIGARKYGLSDLEQRLAEAACSFVVAMDGCAELGSVPKNTQTLNYYHERGEIKGCTPQTWGVLGTLAVTASNPRVALAA